MRTQRKRNFRKTRKGKKCGGIGSSLRSSGRTDGTRSEKLERKLRRVRGSRTLAAKQKKKDHEAAVKRGQKAAKEALEAQKKRMEAQKKHMEAQKKHMEAQKKHMEVDLSNKHGFPSDTPDDELPGGPSNMSNYY